MAMAELGVIVRRSGHRLTCGVFGLLTALVWVPAVSFSEDADIGLGRMHLEAFAAWSQSVYSGQLSLEITKVSSNGAREPVADGVYCFDLANDLASFDQLQRTPPLFWMRAEDRQFVHVGRGGGTRVLVYPRETDRDVPGLKLNFDIRSLPTVLPANVENRLPIDVYSFDPENEVIETVETVDGTVKVVVGSRLQTLEEALESMPVSARQQIEDLISSGTPEQNLPVGRARRVFVFDADAPGRMSRFSTQNSPFGGTEWKTIAVNEINWQEINGLYVPSNVRVFEANSLQYEIAAEWSNVNSVPADAFDVESTDSLHGMMLVDTRFDESVDVGVIGTVTELVEAGEPASSRFQHLMALNVIALLVVASVFIIWRRLSAGNRGAGTQG